MPDDQPEQPIQPKTVRPRPAPAAVPRGVRPDPGTTEADAPADVSEPEGSAPEVSAPEASAPDLPAADVEASEVPAPVDDVATEEAGSPDVAADETSAPAEPPSSVSASIAERLNELEGRISAEPLPAAPAAPATPVANKAPAKKAPAKKAPAKKAPAKKAPAVKTPTATAPAKKAPAKKAPTAMAPAKKAPAEKAPTAMAPAEMALAKKAPAKTAAAPESPKVKEPRQETVTPGRPAAGAGLRVMATFVVLLLAVAAGLGGAAVVKSRPATWQARAVVTLQPIEPARPDAAGAIATGLDRYREKVANTSFTAQSALRANLADREVREMITAEPTGNGAFVLLASASTAKGALALANSAGITLVVTVASDQELSVASQADRLSATYGGPSYAATRVTPTDTAIVLAGLLAGAAVLVIAGVATLLGRSRES